MGMHGRQRMKDELWSRSSVCGICGKPAKYSDATLDHIQPRSQGGSNKIENLQIAHSKCNTTKGNSVDTKSLSGIEPSQSVERIPGVGPILDVFVRNGYIYASRSDGKQPVTWVATDGAWAKFERGPIGMLLDSVLADAAPMEVVMPNV